MCELIRSGAVGSIKIGRRRIVPAEALRKYLADLVEAQTQHTTERTEGGWNTRRAAAI